MKKAKKVRTTAQRRAAAKKAWAARRAFILNHEILHRRAREAAIGGGDATRALESITPEDDTTNPFRLVVGYAVLHRELMDAYYQSASGKGKERHANGRPFDRQPIMENGRMFGPGFTAGQAAKKAQEALGMLRRGQTEAAVAELHGAIVYLAATAALVRETPASDNE